MLNTENNLTKSVRAKSAIFAAMLIMVAFMHSCKKDQRVSTTPAISFVSVAPNPAVKYQDSVKIVISYTDGDGDLGVDSPDVKNLFVTDSRNSVTSGFRISQLAPSNANITIQGNLDIILAPQGFTNDNDSTETAIYSIYVVDQAGHQSNTVQTSSLVIHK